MESELIEMLFNLNGTKINRIFITNYEGITFTESRIDICVFEPTPDNLSFFKQIRRYALEYGMQVSHKPVIDLKGVINYHRYSFLDNNIF